MSRSLLNGVEEEGSIQWWCGWWWLCQGGDWGELGQLLVGGWVAEWATGPGHWPPPARVSSPFFLPWLGADIHVFWLQGDLFSVTNGEKS